MALQHYIDRIEPALTARLPNASAQPELLNQALHYSLLAGGKRIRAMLVYATGHAFNVPLAALDGPACAVECIHAYSLIHDDLPAMDNSDLRRGKPSCHKAFDEATAILAGDTLQALAFECIAEHDNGDLQANNRLAMINSLAKACGFFGMTGGQSFDLNLEQYAIDIPYLQKLHKQKTGALIRTSVELGALAANATDYQALLCFAEKIGLAFQIHDDILDVESSSEVLGKPQGIDRALDKSTYPDLMGMEQAKLQVQTLFDDATANLDMISGDTDSLRQIAQLIIQRQY